MTLKKRSVAWRFKKLKTALEEIAKRGCLDPYDAQTHAASGRLWCRGDCSTCIARKALIEIEPKELAS